MAEKFNLIYELVKRRSALLEGDNILSLVGQGDFPGANNLMRSTMNIKHHTQHLAIDNPEFPMLYDGKENLTGEYSSFYTKTDREYKVISIVKKYEGLMKGKVYSALYFLYCKDDDSYTVVERKEVENLTENFGFDYRNDYLDACEVGEIIPPDTMLSSSTSYDEYGNVSIGKNGLIAYAVHPAVQDDAIIISRSFANSMVADIVKSVTIPVNENTILLNLYGKDGKYVGLPDIGDHIKNGIICATRTIKESRMFSDMRDSSLSDINPQVDQVFYGEGEVIDINVYCNNPNIKLNKVNHQIVQYYNDARWFYTSVYKTCKSIVKSGSKNIDPEINRWMKLAMNYLDTTSQWAFNDNVFSNIMIEILLRKKEGIKIGRKITGRDGNKTVCCDIWEDEDMPYITTDSYKDEYGVVHPKGMKIRVDMLTNPLATINRTIPMVLIEGSVTFILMATRRYINTLDNDQDKIDFILEVISTLNPKQGKQWKVVYESLSPREKKDFINDCISVNKDGTFRTDNGLYVRWEAFNQEYTLRDAICKLYEKYPDIFAPYNFFVPKKKWGRDIFLGKYHIGYQYILMLKQSGDKGFSVRSAGAISDESLPEKSHDNKIGKLWHSEKPIRYGEYETPNFMIITDPNDFALVTALYRSSIDGRRFMYEAILSDDGEYEIPDNFTSRTAEILQVYLKSLGVGMETIIDESEFIGEPEHLEQTVCIQVSNSWIFCTVDEMYYLNKLKMIYKNYIKEHPNTFDDMDDVWDYITDNLPFKKKYLTENIINLFNDHIQDFATSA